MELRQVEYALAVIDHGSFTGAAQSMYVTQPAVSEAIHRLERELRVELFHRVGRSVVLSAAGEAFEEPARQMLRDAQSLLASVQAVSGLVAGRLDVVVLPTLASDPVAAWVGAFSKAHPDVTVRVTEPEDSAEASAMVRSGACELGILDLPPADAGLQAEELFVQRVFAVFPTGTPVPRSGRVSIQGLAKMPLVTTPRGTSTRQMADEALAMGGVETNVAVETGQRDAIVPLVLAGAGMSFLPEPLADEARRRGAVVAALTPAVRRTIGVVYRSGPLSPAASALLELVRRAAR